MSKTKLGFDIGGSSMKIVVMRKNRTRVETVSLPENLMDENGVTMPHAFSQFLKQTMRRLRIPHGEAALVLPAGQVICKLVDMPQMSEEQLMMNLPYEFADFTHGAPDQYLCDYALCQPKEEENEQGMVMMAAMAAKQQLDEYQRIFAHAGVKLPVMLPQEMALVQLCASVQQKGVDEYCFVDLGQNHTRITMIWRDRVQATRQIALSGRNLDMVIAEAQGVDAFLANTYKTSNHQNVLDLPGVAELCDRIAVEVLKVVNFYQFTYRNSQLKGIYLVGGGAALPPLRKALEETIGLEILDPGKLLSVGDSMAAASAVFAAGAVMGGM